ncbi:hypothetical protein [Nannocystis pusilla]|uniref:Secreted protein n=1 Tax=Nannocystis pusilla TaxID=889268 RepID=A0ABS7TNB7_9BACT|nr:hypothetical protein [Nannocystis pusilla]MBZ5709676.1 hypothetical protein [Nannocystis pusilla]
MHGLLRRVSCLLPCCVLIGCTDRATPGDTDKDDTTTATTTTTVGTLELPSTTAPTTTDPTTTAAPTSTTGDGVPGVHAGACKPIDGDAGCPAEHVCCSDDPATSQGRLPNYWQDGKVDDVFGNPLFSSINNELSHWGFCIDVGEFPSPFANGCPVPCNPTWTFEERIIVCGGDAGCCPFTAVDPAKDCIRDPDTGRWRTARGQDVIDKLTPWGAELATNQDPFANSCTKLANGDQAALLDCIRQLGVADQRGYCFTGECPCVEDVCDQKNPDYLPRCP